MWIQFSLLILAVHASGRHLVCRHKSCIFVAGNRTSWYDARTRCRAVSGDLMDASDTEILDLVKSSFFQGSIGENATLEVWTKSISCNPDFWKFEECLFHIYRIKRNPPETSFELKRGRKRYFPLCVWPDRNRSLQMKDMIPAFVSTPQDRTAASGETSFSDITQKDSNKSKNIFYPTPTPEFATSNSTAASPHKLQRSTSNSSSDFETTIAERIATSTEEFQTSRKYSIHTTGRIPNTSSGQKETTETEIPPTFWTSKPPTAIPHEDPPTTELTTIAATTTAAQTAAQRTTKGGRGDLPDDNETPTPETTVTSTSRSTTSTTTSESVECPDGKLGRARVEVDPVTGQRYLDQSECRSPWLDELLRQLTPNDSMANSISVLKVLVNRTTEEELGPGDVEGTLEILDLLNKETVLLNSQRLTVKEDPKINMTLSVYSNLLSGKSRKGWKTMSWTKRRNQAARFMSNFEEYGHKVACRNRRGNRVRFRQDHLGMEVSSVDGDNKTSVVFSNGISSLIMPVMPSNDFPSQCGRGRPGVRVGVWFEGLSAYLPPVCRRTANCSTTGVEEEVTSDILGYGFQPRVSVSLPLGSAVLIHLRHRVAPSTCVFWNFSKSGWDTGGCERVTWNSTHTTCSCSHLTNFALLMDYGGVVRADDMVLTILSLVTGGLSILGLLLTLVCLSSLRALRNRRNVITCHLCVTLLTVNLLVLFGMRATPGSIGCKIVVGLLHYSALAAFAWMGLEGLHLYRLVVVVFQSGSSSLLGYLAVGYGCPLLIVGVTYAFKSDSYVSSLYCWLDHGAVWGLVAPCLAVILVNVGFLIVALRVAAGRSKTNNKVTQALTWVKGTCSLCCILGVGWLLGFLDPLLHTYIFSYLFVVVAGSQGLFIFMFQVVFNEETRKALQRTFRRKVKHSFSSKTFRTTTSSTRNTSGGAL